MKKANVHRGRIEEHAKGFGTADEELVVARAREIAVTNGRLPEQYTEGDLQEAREELKANQNVVTRGNEGEESAYRDGPIVSTGRAARTKAATDEQAEPERLVQEGVDEATHEQMVQGNRQSRRRDLADEDQLPSS